MESRGYRAFAGVMLAAVASMALARAWHCDDAFITFRVVDQLLAGNGPVFNAGERVQVFTHPLWFLLLAAWNGLGLSLHPGAMALALLAFTGGLAALAVAFRDRLLTLGIVLLAMFFSRAVMDFASSGLETPLSFLLAMVAVLALRAREHRLALFALALLPLNRLDLVAWALPFAFLVPASTWRGRIAVLAALATPAALWALFSTIYYGAPLPNTATAKLGGDLLGRIDMGSAYLASSMLTDPGTFAIIVTGIAVGIARRRADPLVRAGLASLVLCLAYVAWAGGDFMLGRFLVPAAWAAIVVILAAIPAPGPRTADRRWLAAFVVLLALLHALMGRSTLDTGIGMTPTTRTGIEYYQGATDERRIYLPWMGLFAQERVEGMAHVEVVLPPTDPEVATAMGARAYYAPRSRAIVDTWALSDPLLARVRPFAGGRPGHAFRPLPREFWRWRESAHRLGNDRLDALAPDLRLAHRAPELFSGERFAAIARLLVARPVRLDAIDSQRTGDWIDLAVRPAQIDRRTVRPGLPVAWMSRPDCEPAAWPAEGGFMVPAGPDGVAHIRCPARDFSRTPLYVRGGTRDTPDSVQPASLDDAIPLVAPRGTWLPLVPSWALSGWRQ